LSAKEPGDGTNTEETNSLARGRAEKKSIQNPHDTMRVAVKKRPDDASQLKLGGSNNLRRTKNHEKTVVFRRPLGERPPIKNTCMQKRRVRVLIRPEN